MGSVFFCFFLSVSLLFDFYTSVYYLVTMFISAFFSEGKIIFTRIGIKFLMFHFENLTLFLIMFNIFRSVYFLFQCFSLIKILILYFMDILIGIPLS